MNKLTTMTLMVTLGLVVVGCNSGSEQAAPPAVEPPPTGFVANGSTYYQTNCGTCHKAGADDPTSAFGAADLAQRQDMIATDMSNYDTTSTYNLMLAFNNIPAQRVADLKAYLASVPQI